MSEVKVFVLILFLLTAGFAGFWLNLFMNSF